MKIKKRKITAASDYRTFDGLSIDELQETRPDIYEDYFDGLDEDVDEVFISNNPNCAYIGMLDAEGKHWIYRNDTAEPGWFEVTFRELFKYLN